MDAVINLRHEPALRDIFEHAEVHDNTVLIDRRTRWGNMFRIGPDGTRSRSSRSTAPISGSASAPARSRSKNSPNWTACGSPAGAILSLATDTCSPGPRPGPRPRWPKGGEGDGQRDLQADHPARVPHLRRRRRPCRRRLPPRRHPRTRPRLLRRAPVEDPRGPRRVHERAIASARLPNPSSIPTLCSEPAAAVRCNPHVLSAPTPEGVLLSVPAGNTSAATPGLLGPASAYTFVPASPDSSLRFAPSAQATGPLSSPKARSPVSLPSENDRWAIWL